MRFGVLVLLAACTDAAEVPATVVHIDVSNGLPYEDSCGPSGSTAITANTRAVKVLTSYDAADITGYVQLQYGDTYTDQVLTGDETVDVYAAYGDALLYRLTADGEIKDIDTMLLTAASDNMLQFEYAGYTVTAQETHVIDPVKPVRLETDDPGIMDSCCSVGDWRQGGLVTIMILFGLRRRRAT